jgi:hypothetical protein
VKFRGLRRRNHALERVLQLDRIDPGNDFCDSPVGIFLSAAAGHTLVETEDLASRAIKIQVMRRNSSAEWPECDTRSTSAQPETRAILGNGRQDVLDALQEIQAALPFRLEGINSDNGSDCYASVHTQQTLKSSLNLRFWTLSPDLLLGIF